MIVVGGESFQHASRFLKEIPAVRRKRILDKLYASLLMVHADSDVPRWIVKHYQHLSRDQAAVVKYCQRVT